MTATALAIYVVFALLAFVWRGWLQYRRTGDDGFRGFSGRIGSIEWFAGVLLALGACAGLVALVAGFEGTQRVRLPTVVSLSGLGLMVLGALLTLVAQVEMGSSWRVGVQSTEVTALITTGLFRWVRNPIFAAMLVVLLGVLVTVPGVIAACAFTAAVVGIELQVRRVEEPYLLRIHGERYRSYAQQVGRFFPGIGRIR